MGSVRAVSSITQHLTRSISLPWFGGERLTTRAAALKSHVSGMLRIQYPRQINKKMVDRIQE
jgi:hypothetical protein